MDYLERRAGTKFTPDMVEVFLRILREGERRSCVLTGDLSEPAAPTGYTPAEQQAFA